MKKVKDKLAIDSQKRHETCHTSYLTTASCDVFYRFLKNNFLNVCNEVKVFLTIDSVSLFSISKETISPYLAFTTWNEHKNVCSLKRHIKHLWTFNKCMQVCVPSCRQTREGKKGEFHHGYEWEACRFDVDLNCCYKSLKNLNCKPKLNSLLLSPSWVR